MLNSKTQNQSREFGSEIPIVTSGKNTMKNFLVLLIAAMSTLSFNVKAGCPHILVSGSCLPPPHSFAIDFYSNTTHNVTVCVGATLTFDLQILGNCQYNTITTNVTGGYPPCNSSFPGWSGPEIMGNFIFSTGGVWSCTFNAPGIYQYIFCVPPYIDCDLNCVGCATLNIEVKDEFTITGFQNNCTGLSTYTLVPPAWYVGGFSIDLWYINGMSNYNMNPIVNSVTVDYSVATFDNNGTEALLCANITTCCGPKTICIPIYKCCKCPLQIVNSCLEINNATSSNLIFDPLISPFITNSSGTDIFSIGNPVYINGTFIIDNDFRFEDCPEIKMGPEAQILITNGKILTFSSPQIFHSAYYRAPSGPSSGNGIATLVKAGCDIMWDGIYFEDGPSGVGSLVINPSPITNDVTFRDARNIIVSDFGAPFNIRYANFENNNTDIVVNRFTGSGMHPGWIEHSVLTTDPLLPMLPYYTPSTTVLNIPLLRTKTGIEINEVEHIQIGSTNAADQNQFSNMDVGIWSKQSWLTAYNNSFDNIRRLTACASGLPPPPCALEGICIAAQSSFMVNNNPAARLDIGSSSPGLSNSFTDSDNGIWVQGRHPMDVALNTFDDVHTGIDVFGSSSSLMNINNNILDKYTRGIKMLRNGKATINIIDNDFNPVNTVITPGAAIAVQEPLLNLSTCPTVTISANTIFQSFTGILATNLVLANINALNDINFAPNHPPTGISYGIRVQNNNRTNVLDNWIWRCSNQVSMTLFNNGCFPGTAPNADYISPIANPTISNLSGISVETSNFTSVINNYTGYLGAGIRGFNIPGNNIFQCNVLGYNRVGFWFDNSDPGVQGASGFPQDNRWNIGPTSGYTPFQDVYGFGPSLVLGNNWFIQNIPGTYPWNPPLLTPFNVIVLNPTSNTNTNCTYSIPFEMNELAFQESLADIIRATEDPNCPLSEERIFMSQLDVYKELMYDPDLMDLGTDDDAYLQAFYDEASGTAIGELANVRFLIGEEDLEGAQNENSNVTPLNQSAENEKITNEIYLATWAKDIYAFTQAQYNALLDIAEQNPISGGPAVYTARVMLGLDFNDIGPSGERLASSENVADAYMRVYPNPADNMMNVEYSLGENATGEFVLTDLLGREIIKQNLDSALRLISVSTKDIEQGIYFLCIKLPDETKMVEKLTIAR